MKKPFYTLYDKVKVYSGAPVNKGFYNRNLNKANKLYIKDNWRPPKPKPIKKITKITFNQKIHNYMDEYKILKQQFNFPEEEKQIKFTDKNYNKLDREKLSIINKIFDEGDDFSQKENFNNFDMVDKIFNSMKDDKYFDNNKDLSFLKTTQNINDYNMRLYQLENEIEKENQSSSQIVEDDKNISLNNINNEGKIDENNEEQYTDNNPENEDQNEDNNNEKDNNINIKDENNKNVLIKNEEKIINQNTNENDILKEKNINTNNNNEYPLFESLIQFNYNKEYSPYNYYNEEYKKKIDELEELDENEKKIDIISNKITEEDNQDFDYENEFRNEENSYNESKVLNEEDSNESNKNNQMEMEEDFINDNNNEIYDF